MVSKPDLPFMPPEPGVVRFSGPLRGLAHALVGLACWALLAYAWFRFGRGLLFYNLIADLAIGLGLVCVGALTVIWWVIHNIQIVRRRGEQRRTVRRVPEDWTHDFLGRRITGPLQACRGAAYVEISMTWDEKRYRPAPLSDLGLEALAQARRVREEEAARLPLTEEVIRR